MWKKFWGDDTKSIERSNRRNVVPGAWRIEVSPAAPKLEDNFLHLFEIGDRGTTGKQTVELLEGAGLTGAACSRSNESGIAVLFSVHDSHLDFAEVTLPSFPSHIVWIAGLIPDRHYNLELAGSNLAGPNADSPGVPVRSQQARANENGILQVISDPDPFPAARRLRLHAL